MAEKHLNHLGLIPDGIRRWAQKEDKPLFDSYLLGMEKLSDFTDHIFSKGISSLSIYALSKENLHRPSTELDAVYKSETFFLSELLPELIKKWDCQVIVAGDSSLLPETFKNSLLQNCIESQLNAKRKLFILAAYNPFDEIEYAFTQKKQGKGFWNNLWVNEAVDLVIRTGYGQLLSNFLPLQCGYAELRFIQKLFNDITIDDIDTEITSYLYGENKLFGK